MKLTAFVLAAIVASASAGKASLRLPDTFEIKKGNGVYDCNKRGDNVVKGDADHEKEVFKYFKLKKWVFPQKPLGFCKFDTFRCKIAGGECMTLRQCGAKGPKHVFKRKLCGKKWLSETFEIADVLEKDAGETIERPSIGDDFKFKRCGCCIPPEEEEDVEEPEDHECGWGCAPADYSTCPCAPANEAGCEAHEDKTGDNVCAFDAASGQCVGCTSIPEKSRCDVAPNCVWNLGDSKCVASGPTTSPFEDSDGNVCA